MIDTCCGLVVMVEQWKLGLFVLREGYYPAWDKNYWSQQYMHVYRKHGYIHISMYSGTYEWRTLGGRHEFSWFVLCIEVVLFKRFKMHCTNFIWAKSCVLCREALLYCVLIGRVHYWRFHWIASVHNMICVVLIGENWRNYPAMQNFRNRKFRGFHE